MTSETPTDILADILDLAPAIKGRHSGLAFTPQPIEAEKIHLLFEAARWSASSSNTQPWRFVWARPEDGDRWQALLHSLNEPNQIWAQHAGLLVAAFAQTLSETSGNVLRYAWHDVGAASTQLMLQASHMGLISHMMGGFNHAKLAEAVSAPHGFEPVSVTAIGYPGAIETMPEAVQERARRPRSRKPLEDLVFSGGIWK